MQNLILPALVPKVTPNESSKRIFSTLSNAPDAYRLMLAFNDMETAGHAFTSGECEFVRSRLFASVSDSDTVRRFHESLGAPEAKNGDLREMYPIFFIPPYNGGSKLRTVTGAIPATHILSANAYELEILRVLYTAAGNDPLVQHMLVRTQRRLDTTCFGKFCGHGECYDSSAVALRFYTTVFPKYRQRIGRLISGLLSHHDDKKRSAQTDLYILLALGDISAYANIPEAARLAETAARCIADAGNIKIPRTAFYIDNMYSCREKQQLIV